MLIQEYAGNPDRLKDQHSNPQCVVSQINHEEPAQRNRYEGNKREPLPPANLISLIL